MTASAPTGTVTFLFTDIEGSTRRWEEEPDAMQVALAAHDEVLRAAIEARGGWLFKHMGDGVCAAFASARGAVDAAIDAQRVLELPVRMGIATGEAELRGDDYFGPALNRAARVMSAGHGGQILVAASTTALVTEVDLLDLGERRLRDLPGAQRLYQVRADGLRADFPPLKTVDGVPGNLRAQATSFVGREAEVAELMVAVQAHRLVTLTGVGGVGKTRLALQVAAELVPEFPEGVWLVELAPVGDPSAVPDAVAMALGLTPQAGMSVTESVAEGLAGRRLLIVFDNCEHVLNAVADVAEAVLARSNTVKVLVTSREGLRVPAEHLWPVPTLGVREGIDSTAVALFVERARAVVPGFELGAHADAVMEICRRLDGIALAIELAAARMVSMSPADVRDRLGDRFRLLAGGRRGLERHQTLQHAVQWSYDLLTDDERVLLNRCSVFAGGFDLKAAVQVCGGNVADEYAVLELLDSLVRKSLVVADQSGGAARYTFLETIRQFAEDQLAASGTGDDTRDRHARHFAVEANANFERWASPRQREAYLWLDAEFANLRAAFRWTVVRNDLDNAAIIANKAAAVATWMQSFEPVGWAEELLGSGRSQHHRSLRQLYASATLCCYLGRLDDSVRYSEAGLITIDDPDYDAAPYGWDILLLSTAYLLAGRLERYAELSAICIERSGDPLVIGRGAVVWALATMRRFDEAIALAGQAVAAAEASGIPMSIAIALNSYAMALTQSDPVRALMARRRAVVVSRDSNNYMWEAITVRELAGLEAAHGGDPRTALASFDDAIDSFHRSGAAANLVVTFASLAEFFDRIDRPNPAATLYGASRDDAFAMAIVPGLPVVADHLREVLGVTVFDDVTREGAAMDRTQAVQYARAEIQRARDELGKSP
ncbi:MAG: adenylate/guanylate cyclase domain-containing protein [Dehalococcoidia bacterium]